MTKAIQKPQSKTTQMKRRLNISQGEMATES